jgi:hypothetical protein
MQNGLHDTSGFMHAIQQIDNHQTKQIDTSVGRSKLNKHIF